MAGYRIEIDQFTPNSTTGESETTMTIYHKPSMQVMHHFFQRDKVIAGNDYTITESETAEKMLRIAANTLLLKRAYDRPSDEIGKMAVQKTEAEQ